MENIKAVWKSIHPSIIYQDKSLFLSMKSEAFNTHVYTYSQEQFIILLMTAKGGGGVIVEGVCFDGGGDCWGGCFDGGGVIVEGCVLMGGGWSITLQVPLLYKLSDYRYGNTATESSFLS